MYGKLTIEQANKLAAERTNPLTLFSVGDQVMWRGTKAVIVGIEAYGERAGLWLAWCTYNIELKHGDKTYRQLVDFTDAHFTCGGTLKKVQ